MKNSIDTLSYRRMNEIASSLESYFKSINFQRLDEIDILANTILRDFQSPSSLAINDLYAKIQNLECNSKVSIGVKSSLKDIIKLIRETIDYQAEFVDDNDRDRWGDLNIKSEENRYLQLQVIDKIKGFAHLIKTWSKEAKVEYLKKISIDQEKIKNDKASLKSKLETFKFKSPKPIFIFSERQSALANRIKDEIETRSLQTLVNPQVSLLENIPLLKEIISKEQSFYPEYSDILGKNRDLAFTAVRSIAKNFQIVSPNLQDDYKLARLAVKGSPDNFSYISKRLKADPQFRLHFVIDRPSNLQWFDSKDADYNQLTTTSWNLNKENLQYVKPDSSVYRKLALAAVKKEGMFIKKVNSLFQDDEDIALAAIQSDANTFSLFPLSIRKKRKFALEAVAKKGANLMYAYNLRGDKEVVAAALKNDFSAMRFVDKELRNDWTFLPFRRFIHYLRMTAIFRFFSQIFKVIQLRLK